MRLAKASLIILPAVGCGAFLSTRTHIRELSARDKAHRLIPMTKGAAPSTQVQFLHEWPAEDTVSDATRPSRSRRTTAPSDDFVRSREVHRALAIALCSAAVLLWSDPHRFLASSAAGGLLDGNVQLVLLVLGYLVVGIPHGLLDLHLTPRVVPGGAGGPPSFLAWAVPYVGAMGLTLGAWLAAPPLMFVLFLLNTILHFGEGDVAVDAVRAPGGGAPEEGASAPAAVALQRTEMFARGSYFGAAVLHQRESLSADFQGVLGGGHCEGAVASMMPLLHGLGAAHYAALFLTIGVRLARAVRHGRTSGAPAAPHLGVVLELTVLSLLSVVAPARVSVFLYLLAFHAPRHVLRAVRFSPALLRPEGGARRALRYGAVTVATMAGCALLGVGLGWTHELGEYVMPVVAEGLASPEAYLVLRLVVVGTSVLTTPHSVVIFLLGRKEAEMGVEALGGDPASEDQARAYQARVVISCIDADEAESAMHPP